MLVPYCGAKSLLLEETILSGKRFSYGRDARIGQVIDPALSAELYALSVVALRSAVRMPAPITIGSPPFPQRRAMPRLKRGRGMETLVATSLSGPLPEAQLRT